MRNNENKLQNTVTAHSFYQKQRLETTVRFFVKEIMLQEWSVVTENSCY